MSDITISFLVLGAVVVLFVWNRFPVELVAVGGALTLCATGVLHLDQSLAGFGDPTVIFIATLFVVGESLDSTGVTAWAGQLLVPRVGRSRARLLVLTMLLVAFLTALISVNGVGRRAAADGRRCSRSGSAGRRRRCCSRSRSARTRARC